MTHSDEGLLPETDEPRWSRLPDYAASLTARHEAHGDTFRRMIADLTLGKSADVLDVAIGDGFFTGLLAARVVRGRVVGVDVDQAFLDLADDAYVDRDRGRLLRADTYCLPFADETFDLVWCAHSLRSLPDAVAAVREWGRVLKPGGRLAVLESDRLHAVVLPWPPGVELSLYRGECADEADKTREFGGLHAGRRLAKTVRAAGLQPVSQTTYATDMSQPLDAVDRAYVELYLANLADRAKPHLSPAKWATAAEWVTPEGENYLPDSDDFAATFLDVVAVAEKGPA